jgi:hypothetical protein
MVTRKYGEHLTKKSDDRSDGEDDLFGMIPYTGKS